MNGYKAETPYLPRRRLLAGTALFSARQQTRGKEKKLNALPLCANSAHIFNPPPTLPSPSSWLLLSRSCSSPLSLCPFSLLSLSTQCANNGSALLTQKVALWRQCSPRHSPSPSLCCCCCSLFSLPSLFSPRLAAS